MNNQIADQRSIRLISIDSKIVISRLHNPSFKVIRTLFNILLLWLLSGVIITGCQSSEQKINRSKEDLKEEHIKTKAEAEKLASANEWQTFRITSRIEIAKNDIRIIELKTKMLESGKAHDQVFANRIESLESNNKYLRLKIENYEINQSDWESFKREFNHDMDEFGQAFKDLTVDNKK